ncbi:hypothetical protein [Actinomycetospora cinnamomea]|uniref:hypothetical protein n=1 Tax=Actinomycetospora cinnamomea TaxID=663609 RepID=UPI001FAEAECE|nr:hypothetical protein [Actinomycetospora cinnamomea]
MLQAVTCGDAARERWAPALADLAAPVADLPALPARQELDPLLDALPDGGRLVVAGDDAALAAVLVRLLRRERLALAVAVLPAPGSAAAEVWGLPTDGDAVTLAREGTAQEVPLVRDDHGGVVAGRHEVGAFHGEVYCEEHLVAQGSAAGLAVAPDPAGGVTVTVTGPRRLGGLRPARVRTRSGRAAQLGCRPGVLVTRDGVPGDRPVTRRSWYRHTRDWRLVRP